jgi:hypothetical protein
MTRKTLLALVAAAALAGCNSNDHTITGGPDTGDNSANAATNGPVTLPPAIAATKLYRCADNSVVQIDWLADNKTANVRLGENAPATQVTASEAGKPMTASDGLAVTGAASGSAITVKLPSGGTKSCHV